LRSKHFIHLPFLELRLFWWIRHPDFWQWDCISTFTVCRSSLRNS